MGPAEPRLRLPAPVSTPLLSRDSGPGLRWLLFLQGCARPCTRDCLNPAYLDPDGGVAVPVSGLTLITRLLAVGTWGRVEGLTVLGGEPTDQAAGLRPLLRASQEVGLSVMLYSGRTLDQLRARPESAALLEEVDLLVDGPFVAGLADPGLRWRGSSNQRVRRLSGRYAEADLKAHMALRGVTVSLPVRGAPTVSGLQDRSVGKRVEGWLGKE